MKHPALTALLAVALALEIGAHLAILVGLTLKKPRWRALAALLMPPLVPLWGWQAGMRIRVVVWTIALVVYAIGVALAA